MSGTSSSITINTGNVLNLIDIKKKAGQNVTEELSESLKLTLTEWRAQKSNGVVQNGSIVELPQSSSENSASGLSEQNSFSITRPHDDIKIKMAEEERKNLKIGVKIFINEDSTSSMIECLENVFNVLNIDTIDNVILAYEPSTPHVITVSEQEFTKSVSQSPYSQKASPISLGSNIDNLSSTTEVDPETEDEAQKCDAVLPGIKVLWRVLEDYVQLGRVIQLGVADIGGGCLRRLYAWARVKPAIAQINLASCCVVPPSLHAFCKANDVQLLTHADPPDLLVAAAAHGLLEMGIKSSKLDWCGRYQVHIKCRGVLALKGYVCKSTVPSDDGYDILKIFTG